MAAPSAALAVPRSLLRRWGRDLVTFAAALFVCYGCERPPEPTYGSPGAPLEGLSADQLALFRNGLSLFNRDFTDAEGLGPTFNQRRCSSCHDLPTVGGSGVERVLKATRWSDGRCSVLTDEGGDNVQSRATQTLRDRGGSGERIPPRATHTVDLVAPALYGIGLISAIPEAVILERVDSADTDGDGISGRAGRDGAGRFARFGQKGTDATVRAFVEGALLQEMGVTSAAHPEDLAINGRALPEGADPAADPEATEADVASLVAYVRWLTPPAPAPPTSGSDSSVVALGLGLFHEVGCTDCHVPTMRTAPDAAPGLADRTVRIYSDLLLHDLGRERETICSPSASPTEVRTAPLMGLRLRPLLLHDGSAQDVEGVIGHHGGEAAPSRDLFFSLSAEARAALLRFLSTL